jgi:hypothetical protein
MIYVLFYSCRNKRTNESTYDNPFAVGSDKPFRPPPPPRQLVGINESKDIPWMKVVPDDGITPPYFWNKYTDESKYDEPEVFEEYDGTLIPVTEDGTYSRTSDMEYETTSMAASHGDDNALEGYVQPYELGVTWEENETESGEVEYVHTAADGSITVQTERPNGSVYIITPSFVDDNGFTHERETWEEVFANEVDADGNDSSLLFYKSLTSAEIVADRPIGQVIIVEDSI